MPKKPLDANKPRGPVTPYTLFVRTCREELRRKYPQLTVDYSVISRKCSERWKGMTDNEKRRFIDTADSQRKRYKAEMEIYLKEQAVKKEQQQQPVTPSLSLQTPSTQYRLETQHRTLIIPPPPQQAAVPPPTMTTVVTGPKKTTKKRERKPKDPHAPKKPLSAYFLFCADERPKVQGLQSGKSKTSIGQYIYVMICDRRSISAYKTTLYLVINRLVFIQYICVYTQSGERRKGR